MVSSTQGQARKYDSRKNWNNDMANKFEHIIEKSTYEQESKSKNTPSDGHESILGVLTCW